MFRSKRVPSQATTIESEMFAMMQLAGLKQAPLAVAEPEIARPEPIQVQVVDTDALAEYMAVADSIGFKNRALDRARLLNFLQREEIPVYDNVRVAEFMNGLVGKANGGRPMTHFNPYLTVWVWKPLRAKDAKNANGAAGGWNGAFIAEQYGRAVPLDVLKTVATIAGEFQDASFYVTDYQTVRPDPFLCVRIGSMEHVVVAVWDEPDFKLTRKS